MGKSLDKYAEIICKGLLGVTVLLLVFGVGRHYVNQYFYKIENSIENRIEPIKTVGCPICGNSTEYEVDRIKSLNMGGDEVNWVVAFKKKL